MSLSAVSSPSRLTEGLTPTKIKELVSLILKSEHPHTSREVLEPLLELLVGGPFDLKENYQIREPGVILLLLELLPHLTEPLQLEIWSSLGVILHHSLWNIHSCQHLQLTEQCLQYLTRLQSSKVSSHVTQVMEILAGYSLSVKELRVLLSYLYTGHMKTWAPHAVAVIGALNNISAEVQPDVFFNFSGAAGVAMTLPPLSKWPTTSGFTFNTWLQIEKPYDSPREHYKPVVYWFRTGRQHGYSAHLVGSTLMLETVGKGGHKKPQTNAVNFVFQSYQWYMLTVVYVHNRIRSSQLCCYVNGKPVMNADVNLPSTDDVYDKCFIGSSPAATEETVFRGQMSAMYLFREALVPDAVVALHKLGPSYRSQFKFDAESDVPLTKQQKKVLFDGHLSSVVVFSYNAKAVDGQLCLEASPVDNGSFFVHSPHATLLEGVHPVITTSFHSALHSLGGVRALFPLLSQLDLPQAEPHSGVDHSLCVKILSLIFELARSSTSFMLQLVQMKAMELISYLLEKASCQHLVTELVSCIFNFAKYLMVAPNGVELLCQLIEHLLFSASLWIRASEKVQLCLYSRLATEFSGWPLGRTGVSLRELIGVPQLLFILREHYSLVAPENLGCYETLQVIRPYLILIVKEFVTGDKGVRREEMESVLGYLSTVPQEENLHDILKLLLALVFEDKYGTVVLMFQDCDGLKVAAKLLACNSDELTLHALQLIGKVLHHLSPKQQRLLIESVGLFAVIREKLLSAGQPVSVAMFNTLFEVLVDMPSRRIIEGHYLALDLSHQIKFPRMLAVIVDLLCSLHTQHTDWEKSDTLMRIQLFSYVSSLCAQNQANCRAVLSLPNWEHWLLMLADQQGAAEDDYCNLQDLVYRLFHTLLLYSFQEEQDGWRVWVETAATMHAYTESKAATLPPQLEGSAIIAEPQSDSASSSVEHIRDELAASPNLHDDPTAKPSTGSMPESAASISEEGVTVESKSAHPCTEEVLSNVKDTFLVEEKPKQRTMSPLATTSHKSGHLQPLKSPSLTLGSPSLSRTSSAETPQSPFFIPRNPFLSLVGKMPTFQWSLRHIQLLDNLLKSLKAVVERRKSTSPSKRAESFGDESSKLLRSNIAHLLALVTDNIIALNGGLKQLLARSSNPKIAEHKMKPSESLKSTQSGSLRAAVAADPSLTGGLLTLCLQLVDRVVLGGLLKPDTIETRMKMEPGGTAKQGLRIVLAAASVSCIQANKEYRSYHEHYYDEKQAAMQLHQDSVQLLQSLGIGTCSLEMYFEVSYQKKLEVLRGFQCLLTSEYLIMIKKTLPRDGENRQLLQQLVVALVYYLSAMCVSKYRNILEATGSGDKTVRETTSTLASESIASIGSTTSTSSDVETTLNSGADGLDFNESADMPSPKFSVEQSLVPTSFPLFSHALDISEQIEAAMQIAGPFLCELLVEHRALLSKVLVGADGRLLLSDAVMKLAENKLVVEMTMLLCSQEWQGSLQKMGGKTFTEILAEGKNVARFSERYLKSVASKATTDFEKQVNAENEKFTSFEEQLSLYLSQSVKSANENCQLRRADVIRHFVSAKELWRQISNVVDETGSFVSTPLKQTVHKKLDLKEDVLRRRLQLICNPSGSSHEEAVRNVDSEDPAHPLEDDPALAVPKPAFTAQSSRSESISLTSDELQDNLALDLSVDQDSSSQLLSLPCQMIVLAHSVPGTVVVTSSSIVFTADDGTEDYRKASYLNDYCPINGKWQLQDIFAIFSRRYLQQNKALELFFANRTSAFFVLENSKAVKAVVRRLPKVGVGAEYDIPQIRTMSLASPRQLFKKSSMTAKWEHREISNFEYIMYLNTIAGRTYNDLNQYPVFPWVLTDYTSEHLDLASPDIYRDLSKPIGALNASRLRQFEERYKSWEDDSIPAFYYGTHYSTMAFVLHWLVRVEPFASLLINFHDGVFDHGSRLFNSLHESWRNSSEDTSDVNELTPEFFYLPELLVNGNKFNLGREGPCDEGGVIDDVRLPPWAQSAHDFIRIHREALESEHVSSTLHHWIDLIFGYKQRGDEAVKAKNVFYYLTYNGAVDLDSIEDPKLRRGLEEHIRHFGQTPAQLLAEPHPQRQPLVKGFPPQPHSGLNPWDPALVAELQMTPDVPVALVRLAQAPGPSLLVVSCNQLYTLNKWSVHPGTSTLPPSVTLQPDPRIASGLKTRLGDPLDQRISASNACFATTPTCDVIFVCGYWDNSFKCFDAASGSMIQSVFGHRDIVTCLHFASEGGLHCSAGDGLICSGSHDTTALLWRWRGKVNRVVGSLSETQVDSLTPLAVLTGHQQSVACVSVSCSLGLVVSGAKRGPCLVHNISGELLYKVTSSPSLVHPRLIDLTRSGHIVIHYTDQKGHLSVFTCNGKQLCHRALQDPALALVVSKDGRYVLSGGFDYRVRVYMTHNLELKYTHEPFNSSIRSLSITDNQRFILVGLASGSVAALTTHFWL